MILVGRSQPLLLFLLLVFALPSAGTSKASAASVIRGRVVDAESHAAVSEAEVVLVELARRSFTDDAGRFAIEGVEPGTYSITVTRLGYKVLLERQVVAAEGATLDLDLELSPSSIPLAEVTVSPGSFAFMGQGASIRQTMSREDVQAVPQIGNDIFRAVNRLPGLASNDYAAHFGVRGGRHDETLILLDGVELYEPYHLKDFNEGAISIIDAETIDGVQLMTGGFPARYGDKRSGVFDIRSRTPEPGHVSADVGVSFLNTRAMASGPVGDKGSWLAFGRTGYMGLVFQLIDQGDLPSPSDEDAFAKLELPLSPHHTLSLEMLHAGDRYHYDIAATTGFQDSINTRESADNTYGNSYVWATLRSTLGVHTTVRSTVSGALVTQNRAGSERPVDQVAPLYDLSNDRRYSIVGFAQDWTHGLSDRDILGYGIDIRLLRNTDRFNSTVYKDPDDPSADPSGYYPVRTNIEAKKSGNRISLYLSNRLRVVEPLVVETGVRFDHASYTGDDDVSPRASAALDLGHGTTLRLGWGHYRQMQGINEVATLNGSTRYDKAELSEQWTAGWDRVLGRSVVRVEAYWKRGTHLRPVFRNWKGAIDAFPESNEDRILVDPKSSKSRGVEVYFDRQVGEHVTARASYSYSRADETVHRITSVNTTDTLRYDIRHPNPQDQRHAANFDVTYRLGTRWSVNASFAFHSGWPATLEQLVPVINDDGEVELAIRPVKLYGARLPDYLRLDMRATRRWETGLGDFAASLEVINLTNHSNVFGYDYFRIRNSSGQIALDRGDETWFSIMPSLGVTWSKRL